ncbi:MAG TPA: hypothetical protein VFC46_12595 [Humisphaera sp.]|nr:hypothetical protein [Humisphaera sp.]
MLGFLALFLSFNPGVKADGAPKPHPYRLPSTNIKERVIWGSTAEAPDGLALSFGGEDQGAGDGQAHTRLRVNGQWQDMYEGLRKANHLQPFYEEEWELIDSQRHTLARARSLFLDGLPAEDLNRAIAAEVLPRQQRLSADVRALTVMIARAAVKDKDLGDSARRVDGIQGLVDEAAKSLKSGINAATLAQLRQVQVAIEQAQDTMSPEPPARALSAIAYEPKTKMFVVFGGDHCDYLTNDTWVFDPAVRKWSLRNPPSAPSPRANHAWKINGDGKLVLTGGYTYFSNTDYMGGQYIDINDGDWTYDVAVNTWAGTGKSVPANTRTYRTGPFLPEYFFEGAKPDAAEFQAKLRSLPANVWTKTNPPRLPQVNRDWGSAVIDPDRDLILRFSGGHCAHGGSDVIEFHLASNRWELCFPVEFPLGQLYGNTEYPNGFNLNRRPWVSGHTYQNYGLDPVLKKMLFLGHSPWGYIYDPERGDWTARSPLPKAMDYSGSMYTLTTTPTPQGLICWTHQGQVFRFDALANRWNELRIEGEKLPGAAVDNSTVVYDSHRDRLLFMRKQYGDRAKYDGEIFSLDMKSLQVARLSPVNMKSAEAIPYLCQIRYDQSHDLLLAGATLPSGPGGMRRTPGYDCAANKWVSFKITGDDPSGEKGRNVSLGLMYDARRNLFWAVDTHSQIFVLRFDPALADVKDIAEN